MDKASEFYIKANTLYHEARALEAAAAIQDSIGAKSHSSFNEVFNKSCKEQVDADFHFQLADATRKRAKKKRKEAEKLERKAHRIDRRRNS